MRPWVLFFAILWVVDTAYIVWNLTMHCTSFGEHEHWNDERSEMFFYIASMLWLLFLFATVTTEVWCCIQS